MRYVDAAIIGGICCICHIIVLNPIGAAASVIRIGPGGIALEAIATRKAAPCLLQIQI